MGKAIRNFKDAISGVEEAKYRHLDEKQEKPMAQASETTKDATGTKTDPGTKT